MSKLRNVKVIESSVYDLIPIVQKNMFVDPVKNLDDLVEWEYRLEALGVDYAIAQFDYTQVNPFDRTHSSGVHYSIFTKNDTLPMGKVAWDLPSYVETENSEDYN